MAVGEGGVVPGFAREGGEAGDLGGETGADGEPGGVIAGVDDFGAGTEASELVAQCFLAFVQVGSGALRFYVGVYFHITLARCAGVFYFPLLFR